MIPFKLKGEYIELCQLLKAADLCESGGQAKFAIQEGRVKVNGAVEKRKGAKIRAGQTIEFDGTQILVSV